MKPSVLCFSGLDPSGGAGLGADIESIVAAGAHASVVCTALTVQDSQKVYGFTPVDAALAHTQANKVISDLKIDVYKSGMLGTLDMIHMLADLIRSSPRPYVCDPVLVANSGGALTDTQADPMEVIRAYQSLLPLATLVTPNLPELARLSGTSDPERGARALLEAGAGAVLIKRGHETHQFAHGHETQQPAHGHEMHQSALDSEADCTLQNAAQKPSLIKNTLWQAGQDPIDLYVARLPAEFHGSGCSLASYIAGRLACGSGLPIAYAEAELWLQHGLKAAHKAQQKLGSSNRQLIPDRASFKH